MTDKTLDEHAEAVEHAECTADLRGWPAGRCPLPEVKAAYEAERAARVAAELGRDRLRGILARVDSTTLDHAADARSWEEQCEQARDMTIKQMDRADKAEATLAETRAQLARLREAVAPLDCRSSLCVLAERPLRGVRTQGGCKCRRRLEDALAATAPGPTLAEIRRAAQVEVLREAASEAELLCEPIASRRLRQRADDLEADRD